MKEIIISFCFSILLSAFFHAPGSLYSQELNSSVSVGLGELIYGGQNRIHSNADLSLNLDLKLVKVFFVKIGVDLFEHANYETNSIIYLGPELRFSLMHRQVDIYADMGILAVAVFTKDGLGGAGNLFLNPSVRYNIRNISFGLELRNYLSTGITSSKANYYFNPIIIFSCSF